MSILKILGFDFNIIVEPFLIKARTSWGFISVLDLGLLIVIIIIGESENLLKSSTYKTNLTMEYKDFLNDDLIQTIKEQIEDYKYNSFALVLVDYNHPNFDDVFDDLEYNHNFFNELIKELGGYSLRLLSGNNLNTSEINLKEILKDVYQDSCEIPLISII